jgi:tol-pal system protein YbgF
MVKTLRAATVFLLISPLLVHCVPTQDVNSLDLRIRNLDNQVFQLGKSVNQMGGGTGQDNPLEQVMTKQAEMADHLDRLNGDVMAIKAKFDENSHQSQSSQADNEQVKALQRKVDELSQQFAQMSDQVNQNTSALKSGQGVKLTTMPPAREMEQSAGEIVPAPKADAGDSTRPKEITPIKEKAKPQEKVAEKGEEKGAEKVAEKRPDADADSASPGDPGKATYDQGLELFRASKFNEAYRTFSDYIGKYPKGKMAPNARFWLGDCYYNQQEYELSILEYQKVVENYPSDAKAPSALLKQGLAFEKLKDNDTAKIVYNKLLKEYPKSDQVETAKKRLDSFK